MIFALFSLVTSVVFFVLGIFVYGLNTQKMLNKIFLLFSGLLSYWAFIEFMYRQVATLENAYFWMKIGSFWPFAFAGLIHFSLVFTEKKKLLDHKASYFLIYGSATVFSIIDLTTNLITAGMIKEFWGYAYVIQKDSWIFWLSQFWAFGLAFLAFFLCVEYYFKVTDPKKKLQTKYVSIGYSVPLFTSLLTEGVARYLSITLPELTVSTATVLAIFVAYAIWKHDLFTLSPATVADTIISTMPAALTQLTRTEK